MAMDAIRKVYEHLRLITQRGGKQKIDLFLYSNGGDGTVPWRLVTLIREYAKEFAVLVPHRAFSAATLTALGADEVIMHPMGMLGPTDPTVANAFNPDDPTRPGQKLGISVEDVTAFIALIKEDVGIRHEDELVEAFNKLTEKVHPLAVGNVKRSLAQSRMMARKLLCLHMDASKVEHKIKEIVDNLTSKLFYHGHPINRREAREQLGLTTVKDAQGAIEDDMWKLYLGYERVMKLEDPFIPAQEFLAKFPKLPLPQPNQPAQVEICPRSTLKMVYVESSNRTDAFELDYELAGQKMPNGSAAVTPIFTRQEWVEE
jgi:Serine dehydrogenase proteinase